MGKQQNKVTGNRGEQLAAEYLEKKGYKILQRNYRSKWGEVDIIAKIYQYTNEPVIVFVEVKTKTGDQYGEPWEMVNAWKVEQVKRMGETWCLEQEWEGRVRLDVVGVWLGSTGEMDKIEHWENVEL